MSRPGWSLIMDLALKLEQEAEELKTAALSQRCQAEDSGGARCTADARPNHIHRHKREDLPR